MPKPILKSILRKKEQEPSLDKEDGVSPLAKLASTFWKDANQQSPAATTTQKDEPARRSPRLTGSVHRLPAPADDSHLLLLCTRLSELYELLVGLEDLVTDSVKVNSLIKMYDDFATLIKIENPETAKMFGVPLAETVLHHSCSVLLNEQLCVLPSAIFESIEYIYSKEGLSRDVVLAVTAPIGDTKCLLRRLDDLSPGDSMNLSQHSPQDALAVLYTFLKYLPTPLPGPSFAVVVKKLCWESGVDIFTSFSVARLLLQMLPAVAFHSAIYVLSFLSQIPYVEGNDIDYALLSQLFGYPLLGGDESLPSESVQEILLWLLENWTRISDGIMDPATFKDSSDPKDAIAEITRLRNLTNKHPFCKESRRRLSRAGTNDFPKLTTIDDVSITNSSERSVQQDKSSDDETHYSLSERSTSTLTSPYRLDKVTSPDSTVDEKGSMQLSPFDWDKPQRYFENDNYQELRSELMETQRRITELEAINEEQAKQLSQSRFVLSKAQQEVAETRLQMLRVSTSENCRNGELDSSDGTKYLKEELASAREERDTAMDIIDAIKGALKI